MGLWSNPVKTYVMNRRAFLSAGGSVLALSATAGCLNGRTSSGRMEIGLRTPTFDEPWVRFGHDNRNSGFAPDTAGPASGNVRWQFDTGSDTTLCSPVVSDGTVYSGSTGEPGDLFALDARTGEKVWQFAGNDAFWTTPTITEEKLFAGTFGRWFYAVDRKSGNELWSVDIGHRIKDSSAVVVDDDLVIFGTLGEAPLAITPENDDRKFEEGAIIALDVETGTERWRYDMPGKPSSPGRTNGEDLSTSLALEDGTLYAGTSWGRVIALRAEDGIERWTTRVGTQDESTTDKSQLTSPVVANDRVYVGSNRDRGIFALDSKTGDQDWSVELLGAIDWAPAITEETVYIGSYQFTGCLGSSICLPGFLGGSKGVLYAVDADTGQKRWESQIRPPVQSAPAVSREQVFLSNGGHLSAFDRSDGTPRWDLRIDDRLQSSPAVAGGMVYLNGWHGTIFGIGPS